MGIFSKVVYTDILADSRKIKCGDFHLLDRVKIFITKYSGVKELNGVILKYTDHSTHEEYPEVYYTILKTDGKIEYTYISHYERSILPTKIVRDYGEFQEEMEALEESVALQQKAEALRKELIETTEKANKAYEKGKSMVNENMEALKIMKSPIINNG